jgi:hypothetical protein
VEAQVTKNCKQVEHMQNVPCVTLVVAVYYIHVDSTSLCQGWLCYRLCIDPPGVTGCVGKWYRMKARVVGETY